VAATQIAYETDTGRILAVHHFPGEPRDPRNLQQATASLTGVSEGEITVMSVELDEIESERNYKIDHARRVLMDVPDGEGGIRFSFEEVRPPS
jgi:hypothetical protein